MADPVRIRIRGSRAESDAPTVEDFIEQVKDLITILHDVEKAIDPEGKSAIEWRVTNAKMNSPIELEATPFSVDGVTYIENRVREVVHHTAAGLNQLKVSNKRPAFFSEAVLGRAKKFSQRVTNGLAMTEVTFGPAEPDFAITPSAAGLMAKNAEEILSPPKGRPYRELGSVEGYVLSVAHDGLGRALLTLKARLSGEDVKCILKGEANRQVRGRQISEVLDGKRVRVHGLLAFKAAHRLDHVDVENIEFMRARDELPKLEDIIDRDLTGGLSAEDYLEALRDGRLH